MVSNEEYAKTYNAAIAEDYRCYTIDGSKMADVCSALKLAIAAGKATEAEVRSSVIPQKNNTIVVHVTSKSSDVIKSLDVYQ